MLKSKKRGILLPVFSLPSPYGIGEFSEEAKKFIDTLSEINIEIWQILPLNFPDDKLSPYNPLSSFAFNIYLISPFELYNLGLLDKKDIKNPPSFNVRKIQIKRVISYKEKLFEKAYYSFEKGKNKKIYNEFDRFLKKFPEIEEISIFITLNKIFKKPFYLWEKEYKFFNEKRIKKFLNIYKRGVEREKFLQFIAYKLWKDVKKYANKKGIVIFGDLPFYPSLNSFEVWKYGEYFLLNKDLLPEFVGGVPPDMFSRNGQLWGNPVYNWEKLKKDKFFLLIKRIEFAKKIYDFIRLDHFRGYEGVYIVKFGEKTARKGKWIKVPGEDLFNELKNKFKTLSFLIAEDLGFITEEVVKLRKKFSIPGMKVFQFEYEKIREWEKNSVSYSSTHDTPTLREWLSIISKREREKVKKVLGIKNLNYMNVLRKYLELSNSNWRIFQLQDLLGLGKEGRINIPGTKRGNWIFRVKRREIEKITSYKMG